MLKKQRSIKIGVGLDLPQGSGAENQPFDIQAFHQDSYAMIHLTERIFLRYEHVLEYQLTSIRPSHT